MNGEIVNYSFAGGNSNLTVGESGFGTMTVTSPYYITNKPLKNYKPTKIVFIDNKVTKCVFEDGTEVFVKVKENDTFDQEVGVALAIAHYLYRDEPKGKRKFLRAIKRLAINANSQTKSKKKEKKV